MRIIAAVQARMGSSRLPNKVMALIDGKPMAYHVVCRMYYSKVDETVLSIPLGCGNDALAYMAAVEEIACYRGEEQDLLQRTLGTALQEEADAVVRVTADCPLIDYHVVNRAIDAFQATGSDCTSNVFPYRTFPAGIAVEIFSTDLLKYLDMTIEDPHWREYFNVWLYKRATTGFHISSIVNDRDLSHLRWTVDYIEDLIFVRRMYEYLGAFHTTEHVLQVLEQYPDIAAINAHIKTDPYHGLKEQK